jgi:hypothetical protein
MVILLGLVGLLLWPGGARDMGRAEAGEGEPLQPQPDGYANVHELRPDEERLRARASAM